MSEEDYKQKIEKKDLMELLKNWAKVNNNHICDDKMFYKIVWLSVGDKIDCDDFNQIVNPNDEPDKESLYLRYEDLYFFADYLKSEVL